MCSMMVTRFGSGGGFSSRVGGSRDGRGGRNSTVEESSKYGFPSGINGNENFVRSQKYDSFSYQVGLIYYLLAPVFRVRGNSNQNVP